MGTVLAYIKNSDTRLFLLLNNRIQCLVMDVIMQGFTQLGSLIFAVSLPVILYLSGHQMMVEMAVRMTFILIVGQIIVHIVKFAVNRPRPFQVLREAIAKRPPTSKYSFPSGHTSAAFCLAVVLATSLPGLGLWFYALASIVGVSRIYLGAHYPTDVIVGGMTAYISFLVNAAFFF